MKVALEDRLVRAGRTLDRASVDHRARTPSSSEGISTRRPRRVPLLITATAAAVVAVVLVGAVFAVRRGPGSEMSLPAGGRHEHPAAAAVDVTRAAPAMAVGISVVAEEPDGAAIRLVETWHHGASDRWEQLTPTEQSVPGASPPAGVTVRLYVGDQTWEVDGGRWVPEPRGRAAEPAPKRLLETIAGLDCTAVVDRTIVGWTSPGGSCAPGEPGSVPQLPVGTQVWVIDVDEAGRIGRVDTGDVLDLGPDADVSRSTEVINRLGAATEVSTQFWYENVPEVSGTPKD